MDLDHRPVLLPSSLVSDIPHRDRHCRDTLIHHRLTGFDSPAAESSPDEAVFDDHNGATDSSHTTSSLTSTSSVASSVDEDDGEARDASDADIDSDNHDDGYDAISELPTDSRVPSIANGPDDRPRARHSSQYSSPDKRSPFRNPSSVRAIQLDTTPPHLRSGSSPISPPAHRLSTPSRISSPRAARSYHSFPRRATRSSASKKPRQDYPLVLLHVTLLPVDCPYSSTLLSEVAPDHIQSNWKLLSDKIRDTVQERGILIPHPRDDYDVLEERLLESLDLQTPRILKCGHFVAPTIDDCSEQEDQGSNKGRGDSANDIIKNEISSTAAHEDSHDVDICTDCGRRVRDGRFGDAGTGNERWEVRVYAANGMMRAGAWGAAWREMERVDVEILPWIDDDIRRELERRREQDDELSRGSLSDNANGERNMTPSFIPCEGDGPPSHASHGDPFVSSRRLHDHDTVPLLGPSMVRRLRQESNSPSPPGMGATTPLDEQRRREIYGDGCATDGIREATPDMTLSPTGRSTSTFHVPGSLESPLLMMETLASEAHGDDTLHSDQWRSSDESPVQLLLASLRHKMQDPRNVALVVLSLVILVLSLRTAPTKSELAVSSPVVSASGSAPSNSLASRALSTADSAAGSFATSIASASQVHPLSHSMSSSLAATDSNPVASVLGSTLVSDSASASVRSESAVDDPSLSNQDRLEDLAEMREEMALEI